MARWATVCEIAGNSFTGCRAVILDGHQFNSIYIGSVDWANDSSVKAQVVNRGVKGIQFGISMLSAEMSKVTDTLSDIQTSQAANSNFRVTISEGLYALDLLCVPDYTVENGFFTYDKHSEGWLENGVWRFISQAQYV